jgi:hypothetical protein
MKRTRIPFIVLVALVAGSTFAEFRLSEFSERSATKRRKAFTPWVTEDTAQKTYERYDRKGQFPIYHESSEQGERRIYEDNPDTFGFQIWGIYGEKGFCKKNSELRRKRFILLTASKYTNEKGHTLYRGIWVSQDVEKRMQRVIRRYGISQAYISPDHEPVAPARKKGKDSKKKTP